MKLNKIVFFFALSLPSCIALRFFQLALATEPQTGFFKENYYAYGVIITVLIFLFVALAAVFSYLTFKRPEHPPKTNPVLAITSVLIAVAFLYSGFFGIKTESYPLPELIISRVLTILVAFYFLTFALASTFKLKLPGIISVLPAVYLIERIIHDFRSISKLALVSDNVLIIMTYCVSLVFFMNFAKLYCKTDHNRNFKNLLSSGIAAVILCFTYSVSNILISIFKSSEYVRVSVADNLLFISIGMFISVFLLSHFSKQNLED